jgi:hypothetical protein
LRRYFFLTLSISIASHEVWGHIQYQYEAF